MWYIQDLCESHKPYKFKQLKHFKTEASTARREEETAVVAIRSAVDVFKHMHCQILIYLSEHGIFMGYFSYSDNR